MAVAELRAVAVLKVAQAVQAETVAELEAQAGMAESAVVAAG